MFNLNDTGHEAGIIINDNTVAVFNWQTCGDNQIPVTLSPFYIPMHWSADDDTLKDEKHVDDIRPYLPGTFFVSEDGEELDTDMDIACDNNNDIPALFGFFIDGYDPEVVTYAGTIWKFEKSDATVITIDSWN